MEKNYITVYTESLLELQELKSQSKPGVVRAWPWQNISAVNYLHKQLRSTKHGSIRTK